MSLSWILHSSSKRSTFAASVNGDTKGKAMYCISQPLYPPPFVLSRNSVSVRIVTKDHGVLKGKVLEPIIVNLHGLREKRSKSVQPLETAKGSLDTKCEVV